jgi:CheY-like chemotaxis protein
VLETLGASVDVAHDGPSAIGMFAARQPTVVLLDVGMPGMDGYEVARRLRLVDPSKRSHIVALTGWGQDEDRRRAKEAGMEHHLVKPAQIDALRELLWSLTRHDRDSVH